MNLKTKDQSVIMDVNPVFLQAEPILKAAWRILGLDCVVTSAKDGRHSTNSAHYSGNAIDLRIIGISMVMTPMAFGYNLAQDLHENCKALFYVVLESDHIHLETSEGIPNIKNFKAGQWFYS